MLQATVVPLPLRIVLAVTIVAGCILRFVHLGAQPYAVDETLASLHVSGTLQTEYAAAVRGRTLSAGQLQTFQRLRPERRAADTIRALALDAPLHPPLYYLAERAWQRWGESVAARRSLAALCGVLSVAAAYWLCRELRPASSEWALIAAAFLATSPLELRFAQTAAETTLCETLALVASALLVRACRGSNRRSFALYGVALSATLYTSVYGMCVLLAHAIYAGLLRGADARRRQTAFSVAAAAALLAYAPWLVNLALRRSEVAGAFAPPALVESLNAGYAWLSALGAVFIAGSMHGPAAFALLLLGAGALWALYESARGPRSAASVFVPALAVATLVPLALGAALTPLRVPPNAALAPAWIAIDLALALLASRWFRRGTVWRRGATVLTSCVILLGFLSWGQASYAHPASRWNATPEATLAVLLRPHPAAVIATPRTDTALTLSNDLAPGVVFTFARLALTDVLGVASAGGMYLLAPPPAVLAAFNRSGTLRADLTYQPLDAEPAVLAAAGEALPAAVRKLAAGGLENELLAPPLDLWTVAVRAPAARATADPQPACTPPLGAWTDIERTSPGCRPFAATSPLNRPIPPGAPLMPNSAKMIKYLLFKTGIPEPPAAKCAAGTDPQCAGEHSDYGHPVYAGRPTDPQWTIHCTNPYGGTCEVEGLRVHIPANARPAGGTDHHLAVIDQVTRREYDFWGFCYGGPHTTPDAQATDEPLTVADCAQHYGGRLQTLSGVTYDLDSAGVWSTHLAGRRDRQPEEITTATASGIALLGGAARVSEFSGGTYPHHAGFMVLPCSNGSAVYPISHFDTPCAGFKATNPRCSWDPAGDCGIPYGARWFIDLDDAQIDGCTDRGSPCPQPVKATLKMLAHYGTFFGDTNGEYGWSLNILLDDSADRAEFGTVPLYTYFAAHGLTQHDGAGNLVVAWPSWMDRAWFAVHSHFADPCVSRGDCATGQTP